MRWGTDRFRQNSGIDPDRNGGKRDKLPGRIARLLGLKMVDDLLNNLQINFLEGAKRLINFAFPK
jgi:hypothetical protein